MLWAPLPVRLRGWFRIERLNYGRQRGSFQRSIPERYLGRVDTSTLANLGIQGLSGDLTICHPSFRIIVTASKAIPSKEWLTHEHANMFFTLPSQPMNKGEEQKVVLSTGCPAEIVEKLLAFAGKYRNTFASDSVRKNRKFGTRAIIRIARRMAMASQNGDRSCDELYSLINRSILAEFLPTTERAALEALLEECNIAPGRSAVFFGLRISTYRPLTQLAAEPFPHCLE